MDERPVFSLETQGDVRIMTLQFETILVDDNEKLKKAFGALLDEGAKKIILDLSGTDYVSSLVLASFVYMQKRAKDAGGNLVLCGIRKRVQEILEVTNLDKVFDIVADRQEAAQRLGSA